MKVIPAVVFYISFFITSWKSPAQLPSANISVLDAQINTNAETILDSQNSVFYNEKIEQAIFGALNYLKFKQVPSENYRINHYDFKTSEFSDFNIVGVFRSFLSNHLIHEKHMENTWPGFVSFLPGKGIAHFQPAFISTDYNLFTTASTAYPLFLFEDELLMPDSQFVTHMRSNAVIAIEKFRRRDSYNFWTTKTSKNYNYSYSAPDNIPIWIITLRKKLHDAIGFFSLSKIRESEIIIDWLNVIYNKNMNKSGHIALFNIPNDSDDSSMAMIIKHLNEKNNVFNNSVPDTSIIHSFVKFRDIKRNKSDRYNSIMGENTGAFLTWHKNDSIEDFSKPQYGIIPLKINNIDITVNSNVLHFLALAGLTEIPGFEETSIFLANIIKENKWNNASLYYPEKLWFPYCLSRAIRDGGLNIPQLNDLLPVFVNQIIELQQDFEKKHPEMKGAFPVFDSVSYNLSTALGLNTLLNLGRGNAIKAGNKELFDKIIKNSLDFLLQNKKEPIKSRSYCSSKEYFWLSGPLYSSSVQDLAHWYSNSQNTALVLEAFTKYLLKYQDNNSSKKMIIGKKGGDFILTY